jgi:sialate O-acetylesterase
MNIKSGDYTQNIAGTWKYKLTGELFNIRSEKSSPNSIPSSLFNGMIYPLLNLNIKGAIWYQGEANASRAYQYRELFPRLIESWREAWNKPDLPFFFVQLANWRASVDTPMGSDWAELREAQLLTAEKVPNTGMAVTIDIGNPDDIHPRNKQDVGLRLATQALYKVYGFDIVYEGPVYKSFKADGKKIVIDFNSTGSGLYCKDKYGYLKGFSIAGKDQKFYWAKAKIENNQVIVWSEEVSEPVAVRYAWADNPDDANLYNKDGFPATPFRTDDWKGVTYGVY